MVRVQVIGDRVVATEPLRMALAGVRGVELVASPASSWPTGVDTVVIDQSLGAATAPEGLRALAADYPGASLLVLALHEGNEYRWVHVEPLETAFRVVDGGTGPLSAILSSSFGATKRGQHVTRHARVARHARAPRHATVPAIPCSTA